MAHPQAGLHRIASDATRAADRRRPLLDGGQDGIWAAAPPPIHVFAAQVLGFHTAKVPQMLTGDAEGPWRSGPDQTRRFRPLRGITER